MLQKILFINSLDADYLEDLTFAGLTRILGERNVVSYPTNYHYYISKYRYPKNIGQCRPMHQYFIDRLKLARRLARFEFDAVVVGSVKRDTCESVLRIINILPKAIPLILIDGSDRREVGGDAIREAFVYLFRSIVAKRKFDLTFKREYCVDDQYADNVHPFPFSYMPVPFASHNTNKKYDVVFWAVESDPIRTRALSILQDNFDCRSNGTVTGQTFRHYKRRGRFFLEELSASKIALNFRGVGWDTLRYWEVPGVGTFMISGKPRIKIPYEFLHGEHVIYCNDDLSDLLQLIEYYLRHDLEREEIARKGQHHCHQHHTYVQRAQYFLDISNEVLFPPAPKVQLS